MSMPRHNTTANLKTHKHGGFSMVEILVMATIVSIVTAFGLLGITRARASVRLSGAAREYASYVEKARMHSIRSHADDATERASVAIDDAKNSYDITMDLDGDGTMDSRTITLPDDVSFETVETISFDWRGRTWSTVGGVTTANAQVSIRLLNSSESVSVDITGSGDITIDSRVFDDSVPNVTLKVGDLASGATPTPTPVADATPTPTPDAVATPIPDIIPDETPVGDLPNGSPVPTPTPTATPRAGNPNATPTPTPTATPTPTPVPCTISTDPSTLILKTEGTTTIGVSHNGSSSISITGSSSKPSDLQVTPGGAQTVGAGSATSFTIKSKKSIGVYSITFSSGCGSKMVPVVIIL
jgi:type II secretory pathway pseudopilin PulG